LPPERPERLRDTNRADQRREYGFGQLEEHHRAIPPNRVEIASSGTSLTPAFSGSCQLLAAHIFAAALMATSGRRNPSQKISLLY
jgi:hypothetical protein